MFLLSTTPPIKSNIAFSFSWVLATVLCIAANASPGWQDLLDEASLHQLPAPRIDRASNPINGSIPEGTSQSDEISSDLESLGNATQFVIPPFARSSDIKIDVENGGISLVARGAPLRDVLSLLAEKHGLNLVMAQDAQVPITLTLNHVTLMDAMEAVVSVAGYTWTTHRGIVHVSSISSNNTLTPHVQGRQTRVFELDYVSAVDLDLGIQGMLSPSGRSQVMLSDSQNNRRTKEVIVVEDFPAFVNRIEQYVAQVDVMPRQVLIQVHVLEVSLDDENRHGINLENFIRMGGGNIRINTVGLANAVAGQAVFAEISGTDVEALLEALETHADSDTLASPRVIAMNGQESRLQIGEKLGYRTSTTTETSTQESINFLDVGVVLNVTPRITRGDNVLLYIKPEVSSGEVVEATGLPNEATSEVETNLVVHSGQGVVIGGLIQERESFSESQAPVLGNIKGLGWLFRRRAQNTSRSEIIFVLVPHIIPQDCGPEPWQGNGALVNQSRHLPKIQFNQSFNCGESINDQCDAGNAPAPQTIVVPYGQQQYHHPKSPIHYQSPYQSGFKNASQQNRTHQFTPQDALRLPHANALQTWNNQYPRPVRQAAYQIQGIRSANGHQPRRHVPPNTNNGNVKFSFSDTK